MLIVSVKHDMKRLAKELDRTQRKQIPKVMTQALNKTADNVFTAVKKDISVSTGIAQGKIKPHLDRRKATWNRLTASISSSKRTFNLIRFATSAAIANYRKGSGLKAKAWTAKARVFPGVFVGNKGRTAFVRSGSGRKIKAAYGPSIPRAMVSDTVAKHTRKTIKERFPINFASAVKRFFPRK